MANPLINHLASFSEHEWLTAIEELLPEIHEVDQNAIQIWFRFFPLELHKHIVAEPDRDQLIRGLALQGNFELKDQIDTSHHFLYGHRYWKTVKAAIEAETAVFTNQTPYLSDEIRAISSMIAEKLKIEPQMVNAITAVGLMTLLQVGLEAFTDTEGEVGNATGLMSKSPNVVVAERAKDDSQGLFGFLKSVDKEYSVAFIGPHYAGKFSLLNEEEIASASQKDRSRDWRAEDERSWEGPVPIECTAASCGTCWIGVLGGEMKLSPVARRERRQMKVFGYNQAEGEQPIIRLACQARATGNVTIVIPPWNGVFGRKIYGNIEEVDLEPVTTSAKRLRDSMPTPIKGE